MFLVLCILVVCCCSILARSKTISAAPRRSIQHLFSILWCQFFFSIDMEIWRWCWWDYQPIPSWQDIEEEDETNPHQHTEGYVLLAIMQHFSKKDQLPYSGWVGRRVLSNSSRLLPPAPHIWSNFCTKTRKFFFHRPSTFKFCILNWEYTILFIKKCKKTEDKKRQKRHLFFTPFFSNSRSSKCLIPQNFQFQFNSNSPQYVHKWLVSIRHVSILLSPLANELIFLQLGRFEFLDPSVI